MRWVNGQDISDFTHHGFITACCLLFTAYYNNRLRQKGAAKTVAGGSMGKVAAEKCYILTHKFKWEGHHEAE